MELGTSHRRQCETLSKEEIISHIDICLSFFLWNKHKRLFSLSKQTNCMLPGRVFPVQAFFTK